MSPARKSRAVRVRIRFPVEIRGSRQSFTGEAVDLSVDGLCFRSPILLVAGERVGLSLQFQGTAEIPRAVEVRWVRPGAKGSSLIGVEFIHDAESRRRFQRLLWRIESGDLQGTPAGRGA